MDEKMRVLERNYATEILLALRDGGDKCIADVCLTEYGMNGTRHRRVKELEEAGLIEIRSNPRRCHNRKSLFLTERGRRVADALAEIREVMP